MLRTGFFSFLLIIMMGFVLAIPARAGSLGIDPTKIPKMMDYQFQPQADFEKATKLYRVDTPYDDAQLGFSIRLPKGWDESRQGVVMGDVQGTDGEENVELPKSFDANVLGILGRYNGPPINLVRSSAVVEAQNLLHEISAQNWFINFVLNNGFSLNAMTVKSSKELEALYVQVINDETYVVRVRLIVSGNKLLMARYYLPQDNYEAEKIMQAQAIASFRILKPSTDTIEKQGQFGFIDQSYFNYPVSWTLKSKSILSIERMMALLYQEKDDGRGRKSVLEGHIKINLVSRLLKTTVAQELETFKKSLQIDKYKIGNLIENIPYTYNKSVKVGHAQLYELVPKNANTMQKYELAVTVMQGDDYYYITSLITPSRDQDYFEWAKNIEAYKIVNESMRRSNLSLDYDPNDPYFDYMKEDGQ